MSKMKRGKAVGGDEVTAEMIEALGDFGVDLVTDINNKIYNTGNLTTQMCESVFVVIPKIAGTLQCNKHRTISIMSHITKIILRVILTRIRNKLRPEISDEQYGFVAGKGTTNAIFSLRVLTENMIEVQKDTYLCFIDYEKAFDRVRHVELMDMLWSVRVDGKDLRLIKNLYWKQKGAVRVGEDKSEWQAIERGVRQGCVMSPDLFNL